MSQFSERMETIFVGARLTGVGILEEGKVDLLLNGVKTAKPTTKSLFRALTGTPCKIKLSLHKVENYCVLYRQLRQKARNKSQEN